MNNKIRMFSVLLLFIAGLIAVTAVNALPVDFTVQANDIVLSENSDNALSLDVERGDTLDLQILMTSAQVLSNVEVQAFISGYEYNDINRMSATTHVFDMTPGVAYVKKLSLKVPSNVQMDTYLLRVLVTDRAGVSVEKDYKLLIDVSRHLIQIKDVIFYPQNSIQAGRALLTTVRLKNAGAMGEDGVKVIVSIPELGLSAADYIDHMDAEESVTSQELYLRVPDCFKPGVYEVDVQAIYDDGNEKTSTTSYLTVVAQDSCQPVTPTGDNTPKTIITYGPESQTVTTGASGVVFPMTITNTDKDAKTYVLSVDGVSDWGTTRLTPSNVLFVQSGETKAAYLYVSANENAAVGEHLFMVTVKDSSGNVLKQMSMKADVAAGKEASMFSWDSVRRGLEIALIILVVLLVILGLVLAFNKLRGSNDESEGEEGGQTYY